MVKLIFRKALFKKCIPYFRRTREYALNDLNQVLKLLAQRKFDGISFT